MTRVSQGARQRHFIFYGWGSSGRRESETLVLSLFENPDFTQANYICRYLDL